MLAIHTQLALLFLKQTDTNRPTRTELESKSVSGALFSLMQELAQRGWLNLPEGLFGDVMHLDTSPTRRAFFRQAVLNARLFGVTGSNQDPFSFSSPS